MSQDILLSESALKKRQRLAALRQDVAALYELREQMITFERNNLIATYTDLIGKLQYEEFTLKVAVMRLKRKSQLIQAAINRGECIDHERIEQQVEIEFIEYQQQMEFQLESIRAAQAYLAAPALSDDDANDLKRIYRLLVKRLHPDWNANLSPELRDLFVRAQAAYKSSDVQELRNILLMLDAEEPYQPQDDTIDKDIEHLEQSKRELQQRIQKLKETFPFTIKDQITNEQWVADKQAELKSSISRLTQEKATWEAYVVAICGNSSSYAQA